METILLCALGILTYTFWVWPILFVGNFLDCIRAIVEKKAPEEYEKSVYLAIFSLICMCALPALSVLLGG